ncbi:HK97 family phage prohead protease [Phyllobacterium endophyticum]|nr:HK97 family phage prohead protease [Phyllobacterium endophyticum]
MFVEPGTNRRFLPRLEKKYTGLTVEAVAEDGSFSGYASLFGEIDLGKDAIEAGAFLKSIRTRGAAGIRMLWQHDPNQPIGTWTDVREDKRGLYVEGRLAKGVAKASEVLELMRSGAIDGLSIGFKTIKAKADGGGIRHIHEADLWEISVVTFPMLPSARVGQVKSLPADAMPDKDYSNQHRLLWNIKANEVLIEALKRSPQSEYNCRWLARLREENAELQSHSTLYEPFQIWYRKYHPDQPRVSAGNPDGGQWTDGGGGGVSGQPLSQDAFDRRWGGAKEKPEGTAARGGRFSGALPAKKPDAGPKAPDGTPATLAQSRGGGRRGGGPIIRNIAGRNVEITPEQALRLDHSGRQADNAIGRVRQRDPNWQPRPGAYEGVEGAIRYNEFRAREAEGRIQELNREVFGHNGGPPLNNAPPSRHRELLEVPLPRPNRPLLPPVSEARDGNTKGQTTQWVKHGGMAQAEKDFGEFNPSDIRVYSNGAKVGKLPNGSKIIVRLKSKEGRPTLEFQIGDRYIKVRYD